jgi:hypothetical protein
VVEVAVFVVAASTTLTVRVAVPAVKFKILPKQVPPIAVGVTKPKDCFLEFISGADF